MKLGLTTAVTAARYRSGFGGAPAAASGGGGDTTPPGKPNILLVGSNGSDDFAFNVNSTPGDNGFTGGTCAYYEVRYSNSGPIVTETDYGNASIKDGPWTPNTVAPGTLSSFYYIGFAPQDTWVTIRYKDAAGNMGAFANSYYLRLQ